MSEPKFAVGEVVILQSADRPELNGEATITEMDYGERKDWNSGKPKTSWCYRLDTVDIGWAAESALRKKHQPGTERFSEMMARLTGKVSA